MSISSELVSIDEDSVIDVIKPVDARECWFVCAIISSTYCHDYVIRIIFSCKKMYWHFIYQFNVRLRNWIIVWKWLFNLKAW
jgi:hypothetical protein